MKRKKLSPPPSSFVVCVSAALLMYACGRAAGSPAQSIATANFQEAVQQQNFFSILTSIEERLKSLDNIYSMQLSQTLESKLDQYSRRLEALDTKIIRLEALVMLNLDKISENISTKNFKDDMSRTNLLRKMDSVYEGINHRLSYMDRKYETNLAKIQTKVDTTLTKLEKFEENITVRDSDIEAEISDTIFAIDDLKTTCTTMEEKLYNITSATLNVTQNSYKYMQNMNVDSRKSMNLLHDNIIETLKFMNNKTFRHFKIVEDNNMMLKSMKSELKEDFNDYANKVADMNSYIWKNSDTTNDDIKRIETFVNNTKTEVQNGVRALMVQIGKIPNKEILTPSGTNSLDEIIKNLKTNFQRILTNQDLFLESCHRLQMDEAQIESEISVTLENLINMIEKKIASEMRGIQNLEKALKSHDSRIMRNAYQINNNVISLFEKSTKSSDELSKQVKKIGSGLDNLSAFVQRTIATTGSTPLIPIDTKRIQDKLNKLENTIMTISKNQSRQNSERLPSQSFNDNLKKEIIEQLQRFSKSLSSIEFYINNTIKEENFERILSKISQKYFHNCDAQNLTKKDENHEEKIDDNLKSVIEEIFGPSTELTRDNTSSGKSKCKPSNRSAMSGSSDCENSQGKSRGAQKHRKKKKKLPFEGMIDIRGNFGSEEDLEVDDSEENFESTTTDISVDLTTEQTLTTTTITTNVEDIN